MSEIFTGYIDINGKHVVDGIKQRPIAFAEHENSVELRWIHPTGLRSPSYEVALIMSKQQAVSGNYPFTAMNIGISALEAFYAWVEEQQSKNIGREV